jgi:hypothetical protein
MCTVTYIPVEAGCWLTSNRDENPERQPLQPAAWHMMPGGSNLYYAADAKAGGTWMATSMQGECTILLNGALNAFVPKPNYIRSRGLVLLDLLRESSLLHAFSHYDFEQIAPFTLVHYQQGKLFQARWDGEQKIWLPLDEQQPHIWSSATLYDVAIQEQRRQWFAQWHALHRQPKWADVLGFHSWQQPENLENSICMRRPNGIQTISISAVSFRGEVPQFYHHQVLAHDTYCQTAIY